MDEDWLFIQSLDENTKAKVTYNIEKSKALIDLQLFKKLNETIWEFRAEYANRQIRLFAFWSPLEKALVICTHGIFKNKRKTPLKEIRKAERIRSYYLKLKRND
jgi:phage-related protein